MVSGNVGTMAAEHHAPPPLSLVIDHTENPQIGMWVPQAVWGNLTTDAHNDSILPTDAHIRYGFLSRINADHNSQINLSQRS